MSGPFKICKAKTTGGYEDLDRYKIDEYVVKRNGSIVAINGYTTKKSDFLFRVKFYESYLTSKEPKEQPCNDYLANGYYGPHYSSINKWTNINPTIEEFRNMYK